MALAYLCSQLVTQNLMPGLEVKAYIVDHKYRPESSQEAQSVAKRVKNLGNPCLTLVNFGSLAC